VGCDIHSTHFVTLVMAVFDCVCEQKGAEVLRTAEVPIFACFRQVHVFDEHVHGALDCKSCDIW